MPPTTKTDEPMTPEEFQGGAKPTFRDLYGAIDRLRKEQCDSMDGLRAEHLTVAEALRATQAETAHILREEQRADLLAMEGRLMAAMTSSVAGAVREFRGYVESHVRDHEALEKRGTTALEAHIHASEVAEAREQGRDDFVAGLRGRLAFIFRSGSKARLILALLLAVCAGLGLDWTGIIPH